MPAGIICWHDGSMSPPTEMSLQVRHVPADVHAVLRERAVKEGKSLQEYVLGLLVAHAQRPTRHEVLARAGRRANSRVGFQEAADAVREERERR